MIKEGSTVRIHYTLVVDGETVDSSEGREPLTYVHGAQQVLQALEERLTGLEEGDTISVELLPENGYGNWDPSAVQSVSKEAFREPDKLDVGAMVEGETSAGTPFQATVAEIDEETVTLDLNHPLAGKTLQFDVEVVEVS
jgi:FKBP-type peptidyl-prolyl cis-trans isomerase SlyD